MSYEKYQYRILCEDRNHREFVYSFLASKGVNRYKIYDVLEIPKGRGAGTQHVDKHYPNAVADLRTRPKNTILIIVRDADLEGYDTVRKKFGNDKNIFIIIPKRNIETWFEWLDGEEVDEVTDYKKKRENDRKKPKPTIYGEKCAKSDFDPKNVTMPPCFERTLEALNSRISHEN